MTEHEDKFVCDKTGDLWFVSWGENPLKPSIRREGINFPRRGLFERTVENYRWRMECIREDGGFKRVFAQWLAGKCYSLAHWLENVA